MSDEILDSSDSCRTARPLRFAQTATFDQPLALELGGELGPVTVAYEIYGQLNAARDNAVLICHALSGDSHVASHDSTDDEGWWEIAVGPGKVIDTTRYFVICPNVLGGCRGTTGPISLNPATGRRYGADFPAITTADMVEVQRRLVEHLGISQLLAVVGGSMGGQQVLTWAIRHPRMLKGAVALATSPRLTSQALAFDVVGRNAILHDPNYQGGQYYDSGVLPASGLAIARMLGHITYLSREAMTEKFESDRLHPRDVATEFEKKFSVGSYLAYQGEKFVERFDANSYVKLSMAMDLFDLGRTRDQLARSLSPSQCRWLVVSYTTDWLFPPGQSQAIVEALLACGKSVSYCNVTSSCGHDAFLLANDLDRYGALLRAFLGNLAGVQDDCHSDSDDATPCEPVSIYTPRRLDYDRILDVIQSGDSVLDLGCGSGSLLAALRQRGHERLMGLEMDEQKVVSCVRRGFDVLHADLNAGLGAFADGRFDTVVLSRTLQAVRDVEKLIRDMLRVGRRSVVSFPNFAYHKLRHMLADEGRAPESTGQLCHRWYDSPNIRFFSIADFELFCREKDVTIHRRITLDTEAGREVYDDPNLNADLAIFVISG